MFPNTITTSIPEFIENSLDAMSHFKEDEWSSKPAQDKWSRKEILGHLIDSAMTNIRRLIATQHQQNEKIVYHQNEWVQYGDYHHMNTNDLLSLWKLMNLHYHRVSQAIPAESLEYTCDTDKDTFSPKPLSFLIEDYWGHQQHHLRQIFKA